jgi:hypothetical protein
MIHLDDALEHRPGQVLMADKGYRSASFEAELDSRGITLIRPSIRSEKTIRAHTRFLKPFRQIIESCRWVSPVWWCRSPSTSPRC